MSRASLLTRRWRVALLVLMLAGLNYASAQYYGGTYPYTQPRPQPARQLPPAARNVGGFGGNPYANSRVPPTGMPIGTNHNFFGGGTNPVAHQPARKPFSSVPNNGPLVTSRQAAQIEVARGLWWGS